MTPIVSLDLHRRRLLREPPVAKGSALRDTEGMIENFSANYASARQHWLALAAAKGLDLDAVAAKLEAREGQSGVAEKASRK